jgi:microcompartment protein CcmL/EutN
MTQEELRQEVMRFAVRSGAMTHQAYHNLQYGQYGAQTPQNRGVALEHKIAFAQAAFEIATNPAPGVNLLDMVVFVTLNRIAVEEYWVPQVYGEQGEELLKAFRKLEIDIWAIAAKVLTPEQQRELRDVIQDWVKRNPELLYGEEIRLGDFAELLGESTFAEAQRSGGFLGIKGATGAADEIRRFSERTMFGVRRVPWLLRWHTQLLYYKIVSEPEIQQLLSNTTKFTEATREFVQVAKELPKQISEEREKTIDQLMSEEKRVRGLLADVRQTLEAGTALASQANTTVSSADALVARVQARRQEPIDIKEVQQTVAEVSNAAQDLTVLVKTIEQLMASPGWEGRLPPFDQAVDRVGAESGEWMTYAFRLGVALILILLIGSCVSIRVRTAVQIGLGAIGTLGQRFESSRLHHLIYLLPCLPVPTAFPGCV